MKKFLVLVMLLSVVMFVSCGENADRELAKKTEQKMKEVNRQLGLPAIKNFQEKKLAKMIYELRDREDLICYAYIVAKNTGKLIFLGKCVGYGLPYSVQYSNPERVESYNSGITLPQPEPNGLFMPEGLSATWLMLLDKKGKPRPVYVEPEVIVSPFPLK